MRSSAGSHHLARAALSISAWLVLLMSSLVQAKCTNSPAAFSSAFARAGLDPVLHRLDVVVGGALDVLMACASASEKRATRAAAWPRAASGAA